MSTTAATTVKGDEIMALETKIILLAILRIIKQSKSLEEVYEAVLELANAEGVTAAPLQKDERTR